VVSHGRTKRGLSSVTGNEDVGGGGAAVPGLLSALDAAEWALSGPSHFGTRERTAGTHRLRFSVGPRAALGAVD
jgi:hypothetical protein